MSDNRPIGIFDSGMGGLTVARQIKNVLPNESIIYFGDSKHLPYGNKSKETIIEFSENICRFLLELGCKAIVVACNTASSNALRQIKKIADEHKIPVIDVVNPVAEKAAYGFHQKMGVIATKATVASGIYKKRIRKWNPHIQVVEMATPLLVPVIEEGLGRSKVSKAVIDNYMSHKKMEDIDSLVLGCTHYPIIEKEINDYFNHKVKIIDSPLIVAHSLKDILINAKSTSEEAPEYHFYVSDKTRNFQRMAKRFFGKDILLELKQLH